MKKYDIVMIGHVSKDILIQKGKESRITGGAVVYSSVAAKRSGASVLVITKTAKKERRLVKFLEDEGIDVVVLDSPETTSIQNLYESEDMEGRKVTLLASASPFSVDELPEVDGKIFHLAGLFYGEIPSELIFFFEKKGKLALDAQGVVRCSEGGNLIFKDWEKKKELLPRITYLKTDVVEAEILTGETDRLKAAVMLKEAGAGEVMVTHGSEVILYSEEGLNRAPFTARNLSGRTGRGDTCFAAYLAWRVHHGVEDSLKFAAALTSIKMESPGVFKGTREEVLARIG